jgi:3-methyladenine DNA glycosylase Mpg
MMSAYDLNVLNVLQLSHSPAPSRMPLPPMLRRNFFDRPVLKVAHDLIGATLLVNGVGGRIVEVEAYHLLCSGPGKLCEALGVTIRHNGLPLDKAPFELRAGDGNAEIVRGIRVGITKAIEKPWRYGLKSSQFLSRPFKA